MIESSAAIALAGDRNFLPRIATLMVMLRDRGDVIGRHPVYIFTDDASHSDTAATLDASMAELGIIRGRDYDYHLIPMVELERLPYRYPGISCYLRLWLPNALSGFQRCLYLDGDVLIRDSLQPLIETDLEGRTLGAINEPEAESARRLGLKRESTFNSGILLIDLQRWIERDVSRKALDWLLENRERVVWADQDALNSVLDTDVKDLDRRWNTLRNCLDRTPDPVIVHFNGAAKPWHFGTRHAYRNAYRHWLKKTPWPSPLMEKDSLRHRLKETVLYDFWLFARTLTTSERD
ncbi:glycosyltransferase family 8 protein [Sagittula stellata]|uniref:glycosyltransferase family 8 protein n=1 Tax=Sagittula stellata TaxID=52603 RepID=UPI003219A978